MSFFNFRGSFMVYDGKTAYTVSFFSLIRRCMFFSMNVYLIALVVISGWVLQPSIFGGGVGVGNRLSTMFWWRRKEMCAGKIAWRHAALPFLNAWNMQASDDVIKNLNTRIATGTKINQSDDSNTRSWTAACGLRARRMPNCTCTEVITDTRGNAAQIAS